MDERQQRDADRADDALERRAGVRRMLAEEEAQVSSEELLGYAEGTLDAAERRRVDASLRQREDLRAELECVRRTNAPEAASPARNRGAQAVARGGISRWAAAAVFAAALLATPLIVGRRGPTATRDWADPSGPYRDASGADHEHEILAPRGLVRALRPEIVWSAPKECATFEVTVESDDLTPLFVRETSDCRLSWPAELDPLVPDQMFHVSVRSRRGPRWTRGQWFTVVDETTRVELDQRLARVDADDPLGAAVERARILAAAGLRSEAAAELEVEFGSRSPAERRELLDFLRDVSAGDVGRDLRSRYWIQRERAAEARSSAAFDEARPWNSAAPLADH